MAEMTGGASGAAGAGAGAGSSGAPGVGGAGAATGGAGAAAPASWTASLPEGVKGFAELKGWKDVGQVIESYQGLEKLTGHPQERLVALPKDATDQAAWDRVYEKMGRPLKPEEYGLAAGEGADPEFAGWASKTFHKLGLSKTQAAEIAKEWTGYAQGLEQKMISEANTKSQLADTQLKTEWGAAYDQNVRQAQLAAREFGVKTEVVEALEDVMGYDGVMKLFHNIGSKLGQAPFVAGGKGQTSFSGAMTPDAAKAQIKIYQSGQDPEFTKKYLAGDTEARQKMELLHRWANPEYS